MKQWFYHFFTDETFFERTIRSCIVLVATILPNVTGLPSWVTGIGIAVAVWIGIGQKNNDPSYPVSVDNVTNGLKGVK